MNNNSSLSSPLRERFCEIIDMFKPDFFKFPLAASPTPNKASDGKLYTADGQPFEPPRDAQVMRQDGNALFDIEIDILKAAGITPEMVRRLTGLDIATLQHIYSRQMGYKDICETLSSSPDGFSKISAFMYFAGTVAKTLCASNNFCDYSAVCGIMMLDRNLSPEALPLLTGMTRKTLDAFMNDPGSLPDSDKYLLMFKVLDMTIMLERVRHLSGTDAD